MDKQLLHNPDPTVEQTAKFMKFVTELSCPVFWFCVCFPGGGWAVGEFQHGSDTNSSLCKRHHQYPSLPHLTLKLGKM